jgi:hypothetical protein
MIHLKLFAITLLVFSFMGCSQSQSSHTESVGSINFTGSLPMHYEFADQPELPGGFGSGEFTMELWIKPDHTAPIGETWRGSYDQIYNWSESDRRPYSSHGWWYEGNWLLDGHTRPHGFDAFDTREGTFSLQIYGGGRVRWTFADENLDIPGKVYAVQAQPATEAPSLLDGEWHHIACVRRWTENGGAMLELWVDGRLTAETPIPKRVDMTSFWRSLPHPDNPTDIGGWTWGAEVMTAWKTVFTQYEDYKGLMDELRFWNRALSHRELENDWQRAVKGDEPGLIGWYDFNEVKENAFYDRLNPDQRIELHHFGKENFSSERAPLRELERRT